MRITMAVILVLTTGLSCKPRLTVSDVFKANEEVQGTADLADECRPDPNITGDQIEVCRQSPTGLDNVCGSG